MNKSPHARGLIITIAGVILISPDSLIIRLVDADKWSILFWRGSLSAVAFGALVVLRSRRDSLTRFVGIGWPGFLVAALAGGANLLFVLAIATTNVANVLVILSTTSLFSALLSRLAFGEPISRHTWIASLVVVGAIALIFSGQIGEAGVSGNLFALGAVLLLSGNLAVIRAYRSIDMTPTLALSGVVAGGAAISFASPLDLTGFDLMILVGAGLLLLPMAIALLMQGPRFLPAPEVGLVLLLETLLGPLWVWLALGEAPSREAFLSGTVILAVLAAHTYVQLRGMQLSRRDQ